MTPPDAPSPQPWRARVDGRDPVSLSDDPLDLVALPDGDYSLIAPGGRSLRLAVEEVDLRGHTVTLRLDGRRHRVQLLSPLMQLIAELGLEAEPQTELREVHAPMPGLVLRIAVEPGQEIAAGETLLVLEAMKMENAIKAPAAGTVTAVEVRDGQAVEKGALLVRF